MLVSLQVGVAVKKKSKAKALQDHAARRVWNRSRASGWDPQLACVMESPQSGAWNPKPTGYTPFGASARSALGASHFAWLRQAAEERSALARLNASIQTRLRLIM